jgi:hypothetical protein
MAPNKLGGSWLRSEDVRPRLNCQMVVKGSTVGECKDVHTMDTHIQQW